VLQATAQVADGLGVVDVEALHQPITAGDQQGRLSSEKAKNGLDLALQAEQEESMRLP